MLLILLPSSTPFVVAEYTWFPKRQRGDSSGSHRISALPARCEALAFLDWNPLGEALMGRVFWEVVVWFWRFIIQWYIYIYTYIYSIYIYNYIYTSSRQHCARVPWSKVGSYCTYWGMVIPAWIENCLMANRRIPNRGGIYDDHVSSPQNPEFDENQTKIDFLN